jgi:hypothetical protein
VKPIIQTHHDGHGLNDLITIYADERDREKGGNGSHRYEALMPATGGERLVLGIQFQHGPREVEGSDSGCTEAVLLAVLIDRLEGFQSGPYACEENEEQLGYLRAAMASTRKRADDRAARGVLGRNEK